MRSYKVLKRFAKLPMYVYMAHAVVYGWPKSRFVEYFHNKQLKYHYRVLFYNIKFIVKSIRSISQKSKFYSRAVSKFLYTMCN